MQFQSDILDRRILRPKVNETTALGAAYAAGLAVGWLRDLNDVRAAWTAERTWQPKLDSLQREESYRLWKKAVGRAFDWL
jgi:glycerol kinase